MVNFKNLICKVLKMFAEQSEKQTKLVSVARFCLICQIIKAKHDILAHTNISSYVDRGCSVMNKIYDF